MCALRAAREGKSPRKPLLCSLLSSTKASLSRFRSGARRGLRLGRQSPECRMALWPPSTRVIVIRGTPGQAASSENRRHWARDQPSLAGQGHDCHLGSDVGQQGDLEEWPFLPVRPPETRAEALRTMGEVGRREPHWARRRRTGKAASGPGRACPVPAPRFTGLPGFPLRSSARRHPFALAAAAQTFQPSRTLPPPQLPARSPVCLIRFKPHLLREALPPFNPLTSRPCGLLTVSLAFSVWFGLPFYFPG